MSTEGVDCNWKAIDDLEAWPMRKNKTGFLPSCNFVNSTKRMHHMDANKTLGKRVDRNYLKIQRTFWTNPGRHATENSRCTAIWLPSPSKVNKTCGTLSEKLGISYKGHYSMDPYTWTCQCKPNSYNLNQLSADTRCSVSDLPGAIGDRERW